MRLHVISWPRVGSLCALVVLFSMSGNQDQGLVSPCSHPSNHAEFAHDTRSDIRAPLRSPRGFLHAVTCVCDLNPQGYLWLATVCSSWVWMCSFSTGRTADNPLGVPSPCVNLANIMVARCGLLIMLATTSGNVWTLEQPWSSLMEVGFGGGCHKKMIVVCCKDLH